MHLWLLLTWPHRMPVKQPIHDVCDLSLTDCANFNSDIKCVWIYPWRLEPCEFGASLGVNAYVAWEGQIYHVARYMRRPWSSGMGVQYGGGQSGSSWSGGDTSKWSVSVFQGCSIPIINSTFIRLSTTTYVFSLSLLVSSWNWISSALLASAFKFNRPKWPSPISI